MNSITQFPVPLLGFAAFSGTGKTTLLEKLIPMLVNKGLRIALVKHSHHDIEMDKPGKDSYRLRKAGASQVVLAGTHRSVCFHEYEQAHDSQLIEQLSLLNTSSLDLVLVEGYREQPFPKIELHRHILQKPFLHLTDENIIALVCDQTLEANNLPLFNFSALDELVEFIVQHAVNNK
ncbi:molybdopterin-guanine dinucleotide biosynthesis protein B [Psychromonas sp. RZ22]|uniref:molybdopterin-guanine dinucleotide biosynthesis protein B n=1 Tax=Psychromonas algarum TaxID=2555643 RepID=UPI00106869B6|nr:molybdopterin-guanine dinucleotide biosynthesis protein B [Psychromonas sp. RZ22]TEW55663.1 molybdopterin-guanine dinucleotide biosynthesis protein B [Psychromonas sp. RZ22]